MVGANITVLAGNAGHKCTFLATNNCGLSRRPVPRTQTLHPQKTAGTYYAVTTLAEAMKQRGQAWCPKFALPEATYRNCRHNPELSKIAGSVGVAARALYPRRCAGLSSHHDMGLAGALLGEEERSKTLFLTLLRDPVDRVISEYYYYRSECSA